MLKSMQNNMILLTKITRKRRRILKTNQGLSFVFYEVDITDVLKVMLNRENIVLRFWEWSEVCCSKSTLLSYFAVNETSFKMKIVMYGEISGIEEVY